MITVSCLGHIKTSLGSEEVLLDDEQIEVSELVDRLMVRCAGGNPGFNRYNTLAMVEEGEAFVPASTHRTVKSGERVVLIPFSHGG